MTASGLSKLPKGQAVSPAPSPISSGTSLFPRGDQPSPAQPRLLSCDTFLQLPPVLMETYGNFSPRPAPPPPSVPSWGESAVTALDGSRHPSKGPSHLCWAHTGTRKGPTTSSSPPVHTCCVGGVGDVLPTPPSPITSPQPLGPQSSSSAVSFKPSLLVPVPPWTSHLTSISAGFLICSMSFIGATQNCESE